MSILTIIMILFAIGIVVCILEWIHDNIVPILIVAAIILGIIFYRKLTIIILCLAGTGIVLYMFIKRILIPLCVRIRNYLLEKKKNRVIARETKKKKKDLK